VTRAIGRVVQRARARESPRLHFPPRHEARREAPRIGVGGSQ
jgi:hypothetical protein